MPAPLVVIIIRQFFQWAIKHIFIQYGKKVGIKSFRKTLLFLGKKYFEKFFINVLKMKVSKNGKEITLEKWIEETPLNELNDYFRKFEIEITPEENTSIPIQIKQEYGINWNKYNLGKKHYEINKHAPNKETNNWYTLKGYKLNHPSKTEL